MQRFLTFVVESAVAGRTGPEHLKECLIGTAVFDRQADYDLKSDPVVRVEARRLRAKLKEYYERAGKNDPIYIKILIGSYAPLLERQTNPAETPKPVPPARNRRLPYWAPILSIAAMGVLLGQNTWQRLSPGPGQADESVKSLVVLPFQNRLMNASDEYLVGGLTDEITTNLAKIRGLKVISRTSAQHYGSTGASLPEIARELSVDAVVEGSIMTSGKRVRVTAQLVRAATDGHLWAETYDRDSEDLFTLQEEIALTIARQIGAALNRSSIQATPPHQKSR